MGKDVSELKKEASAYAAGLVESGMVVGLGHGSTSIHAVGYLAQKIKAGQLKDVRGVPCSFQVEEEALRFGMPLTKLEEISSIDLTIDGADEVDPNLNLIKGGGGALLREKVVAQVSRREIIVVDESKLSPMLGKKRLVPVEVIPFGWQFQRDFLQTLGATVTVRRNADKSLYNTDQGNLILDCNFGPIAQPQHLADLIQQRAGIVEHGLFLNLATDVIVAGREGIRHLKREPQ
ncbi:MAG TPA: ribose-5-phosphate isomerase RpiA [Syntrophales bacterium]|nr:ribose-5-phosphate isomerase RpiA [Syntrophales bacterium]HPI57630.1 ribose-5-phosphate isomerase RpiA [Syntrophales bacterium]HPN25357.1 ribose-5-phosphate isomerase RpiA [Syntrophales bacterium]